MGDDIWEHYAKEYQAREARWEPVRSGVPYTCNECPALVEMRAERDRYWATTNDAISERNYWIRLFMLAFDSHFNKTWDGETADLLGQAYDEAECICGDDKL